MKNVVKNSENQKNSMTFFRMSKGYLHRRGGMHIIENMLNIVFLQIK